MIRNRDEHDERIKIHILQQPGVTFSELKSQTELTVSTLRYRLATMELANEIACKKQRNQNQYFPKNENEKKTAVLTHGTNRKSTNTVEEADNVEQK
jgi:predicted transcriptional regulator